MKIKNEELSKIIGDKKRIVIFSGAGVSTYSNISDYKNGEEFYSNIKKDYYEPREILTNRVFNKDKPLFFEYFRKLTENLNDKIPNNSHLFAKYLFDNEKLEGVITQNIDGLYDNLIPEDKISYIHGKYNEYNCVKCNKKINLEDTYISKKGNLLSNCHDFIVKPSVVLYGENFQNEPLNKYMSFLENADCLIVMGTELDIVAHNKSVGQFHGTKILLNKNDVSIFKYQKTMYSSFEEKYATDWDFKIIGDLNELFE